MDKEIQEWLESQGYTIDGYAIVDSNGVAQTDVHTPWGLKGHTPDNIYQEEKEKEAKLTAAGFDFKGRNVADIDAEESQSFLGGKDIENFQNGTSKKVPDFSNYYTKTLFEKLQKEAKENGEPYYETPEDFIKGNETIIEQPVVKTSITKTVLKKDSTVFTPQTITYASILIFVLIIIFLKNKIIKNIKTLLKYSFEIKSLIFSLIISSILGFAFKKYSTSTLKEVLYYKRDSFKIIDSNHDFFTLGSTYYYNWVVFTTSFITLIVIFYILNTTVIGDKIITNLKRKKSNLKTG